MNNVTKGFLNCRISLTSCILLEEMYSSDQLKTHQTPRVPADEQITIATPSTILEKNEVRFIWYRFAVDDKVEKIAKLTTVFYGAVQSFPFMQSNSSGSGQSPLPYKRKPILTTSFESEETTQDGAKMH